jgi:hypothetical protein
MRRGGGKEKGSEYERTVAKILTQSFYPDGGGVFQRVYAYPMAKKGDVRSDLVALKYVPSSEPLHGETVLDLVADRSFPFSVECKNYRGVKPVFCGLYAQSSEIWDWMKQAEDASEGKMPLVIFRLYRTLNLVMINNPTRVRLKELFGEFTKRSFSIKRNDDSDPYYSVLHLFVLSEFLDWIDFGVFRLTDSAKFIRSLIPKENRS